MPASSLSREQGRKKTVSREENWQLRDLKPFSRRYAEDEGISSSLFTLYSLLFTLYSLLSSPFPPRPYSRGLTARHRVVGPIAFERPFRCRGERAYRRR